MDNYPETLASSDGVSVHSGFPNPALDRRGQEHRLSLDLNQLLIRHPSSTYLFRVSGHLWADQGIYDGDIAVVDRIPTPRTGDVVLTWEENGFSLSRYRQQPGDQQAWAVVTAVIHSFSNEI